MPLVRNPSLAAPERAPAATRVIEALRSPDANERWEGARAAGKTPGTEEALVQALRAERDARIRGAMLTSLAQMGTESSVKPVVSMVRSDEAAWRTAALDALRLTPRLPEVVMVLLKDFDADVRLLSCDLARSLPAAEANALLAALLQGERQANVCAAAVEVLAEVGEPSSLTGLADCALRFPQNEFLLFAIQTVVERICAARTRG